MAQATVHRGPLDTSLGRFSRCVPMGGCPVEDAGHDYAFCLAWYHLRILRVELEEISGDEGNLGI